MLLNPGRQSKLGSGAKKRFQKPPKRMSAGTVVERESANAHVAVPMTPGGLGLLPSVRLAKARDSWPGDRRLKAVRTGFSDGEATQYDLSDLLTRAGAELVGRNRATMPGANHSGPQSGQWNRFGSVVMSYM